MAAHAWELWEPVPRLGLLRVRVAVRAPQLDAALAAGADPVGSLDLAMRAGQLADRRRRHRWARSLRRAVSSASAPRHPSRNAAVPVNRAAVLFARPTLLALADDLDERPQPAPRGVALALGLLRDGGGPLYRPILPSELRVAAERARAAL